MRWFRCSKSRVWSRAFDTLLLMLQIHINTYKMNRKLSNGTQIHKNSIKSYLYIIIQKQGIIQRILYKRIDKCHKSIVKITTFWHLSNSPQLELVCPQTRNKQLEEIKTINQRITNRQVLKTENKCNGSNEKRYTQSKHLPLNYDDNINTKQMLNTRVHAKHSKTIQVLKWITPSTQSLVDEKHTKVFSIIQQPCKQKIKLYTHPKIMLKT